MGATTAAKPAWNPPPSKPETEPAQSVKVTAPKPKTDTTQKPKIVSDNGYECKAMTMSNIKRIFNEKGAKGLKEESIDYYNSCIDKGFKW